MSLFKAESYKKGIIYSSAFNVGGKAVAFLQQWLIGYYFGTFSGTDVYFFTYNIILYVSFFFLNLTTSALIPECIKIRNTESNENSMSFINAFIYIYGIIGLVLVAVFNTDAGWFVEKISSFSPELIERNISLIRWSIPLVFLNLLINLLTEIMASYKYFTIPNMVSAVNALLGVLFLVIFHERLGLTAIVIGLIIGSVFNLIVVVMMMKKQLKWNFFRVDFSKVKLVAGSGLYTQLGFVVYLFALYLPQYFFSTFSEGSLTAMNYADKISSIPGIFLITQVTSVMAIKYNNLVSMSDSKGVAMLTHKLIYFFSTGLFVVAVAVGLFSDWMVDFLFGYGKFSEGSLSLASDLLMLMIMVLPFTFTYNIYIKMLNAYKKQNVVLLMQVVNYGSILLLYYFFIPRCGTLSFPILRLIPFALSSFIILPIIKRYCPELKIGRLSIIYGAISLLTALFISVSI